MVCGSRAAEIGGIKRVDFWIKSRFDLTGKAAVASR
jgi:hypothetical protein